MKLRPALFVGLVGDGGRGDRRPYAVYYQNTVFYVVVHESS